MAVGLCVTSFALGLLCIDMFCDHYSLVSSSPLTAPQFETCYSYYRNGLIQPWYTSLATSLPILIGTVVMLRNFRRTIYDTLSVPVFAAVVAIFLFGVKKYMRLMVTDEQGNNQMKEGYLKQIAQTHLAMGVLLVGLLVLQTMAERKAKTATKKHRKD